MTYRPVYKAVLVTESDHAPDPRSAVLCIRVTGALADRVDAARGLLTRTAWLEQAVVAFLESGASLQAVVSDAAQAQRLRGAFRGTPEVMDRLRAAQARPLPARCGHRKRGGYCEKCRSLVDVDGYPVRAP